MDTDTVTAVVEPGTYKGKTAEQWRAKSRASHQRSAESFDRSDTDGFMSQWAADMAGMEYSRCADLAERNSLWEFTAVFDLDGNLLDARRVKGTYGESWLITTADGKKKWFNESNARLGAKRLAADEKKGFRLGRVRTQAYVASGSGGPWRVYYYYAPVEGAPREVVDNGTGGHWYEDRT